MVDGKPVSGNYIVVDSDVVHSISESEKLDCFMLIEATSAAAKQLQGKYIEGGGYSVLPAEAVHKSFAAFFRKQDESSHHLFSAEMFKHLGISFYEPSGYDERITALLGMLGEYTCIEDSIDEIARQLFLSPSRLSHLFSEQTGAPLKSYMVLYKLRKAYLLLFNGKSITEAAAEAGFYSPSHLADVNRRMMGMTITEAIGASGFLEVTIK